MPALIYNTYGIGPWRGLDGWLCDRCAERQAPDLLMAAKVIAGEAMAMEIETLAVEEVPEPIENDPVEIETWPADHLALK